MASKAKTRVKIDGTGRTVVAKFPVDRLRALLQHLPESEDRTLLEGAVAECDVGRAEFERERRLEKPLSIESLAPLGWMLTGTHSTLAYGAIREGDFRHEGDDTWAYGPPGAFDREPAGTIVMREGVQAGVMSEEHGVYRLLAPTTDRQDAITSAMRLEAGWRKALPAKRRKPKALLEGGIYGVEAKGGSREDWHRYMEDEDLEGLPEGATKAPSRTGYKPSQSAWRVTDIVHRQEGRVHIGVFQCDAVLRPVIYHTGSSTFGYTRTGGLRWSFGRRAYDPAFDLGSHRPSLTSPYDCVLGSVWSAMHNGALTREQVAALPSIRHCAQSGGKDRRDNDFFPLASREEADAAALGFAIDFGLAEGRAPATPDTIPVPDMECGVDLSVAA